MHSAPSQNDYRGIGPATGPDAVGVRVDLYLARSYPFRSRNDWNEVCRRKHLLINGRPVRAGHRLKLGDRLSVFHPLSEEPEADLQVELLVESRGVMALNKPANLPMHESGHYRRNTLHAILASQYGSEWFPVHRLDRETSGVVICGATPIIRRQLSADFEAHRVDKRYLAIVRGAPTWSEINIEQPIALADEIGRPRYEVRGDGAYAHTEFTVKARGKDAALVEARPRTGRTNQIRVHAAWAGHPLIGDKIYQDDCTLAAYREHGDSSAARTLAGFDRHALHAAGIKLKHPSDNSEFAATAVFPKDLHNLWQRLNSDELTQRPET